MIDRSTNRPIRRRAKARDVKHENTSCETEGSQDEACDDKPVVPTEQRSAPEVATSPVKQGFARRVYDPNVSATSSTRKSRTTSAGGKGQVSTTGKGQTAGKRQQKRGLSKEQQKAKQLAQEKGIPPLHALRVVRGEVGINDVLKSLVRKEQAARLIAEEGLTRDLAGQVASGHLRIERAHELQRIRSFRLHRIDRDVIHIAAKEQGNIAFQAFERSWQRGLVKEARTYEFDFVVDGGSSSESMVVQKHDVKTVCADADFEKVFDAMMTRSTIAVQKLAGTSDPGERVRPKDGTMLDLLEAQQSIDCILRDGTAYHGRIVSFGRWDLDLKLESAALITIFFHALHEATPWMS